jgi:hypothetical protein
MKWPLLLFPLLTQAQTTAPQALEQFHQFCVADKTPLWGVTLWGPIVLLDPSTRSAIATQRDPDGKFEQRGNLFYGTLPGQFTPANTSIDWGGQKWAMIMLPLPASPYSRIQLLAHESFHRLQPQLNLTANDQKNGHLDTEVGRVWLRMELRALARALRTSGNEARAATQDALAFRATRQNLFPDAKPQEAALEIQEGLAEYTGTVLALKNSGETIDRVARATEDFEDHTSFTRSFAYATGPALGLLLDRYQPNWRKSVTRDTDLAAMLSTAAGSIAKPREIYGYPSVRAEEHEREARQQERLTEFRKSFVDGPALQFPRTAELYRTFNPSNLVSMGEEGTVYPTGTFQSVWGRLQVDDVGALLAPDNQSVRVVAPSNAESRTGPGWKLELAPGWTIRPAKPGNFEVVRQ